MAFNPFTGAASIGLGIGLGFFSSYFAAAGLFLLSVAWAPILTSKTWKCFLTVFSAPFIGAPAIVGTLIGGLPTFMIGYILATLYLLCIIGIVIKNKKRQNPKIVHIPIMTNVLVQPKTNNNINTVVNVKQITAQHANKATGGKAQVYTFCGELDLLQYYEIFIQNGYESKNDLITITENDLTSMGITKHLHKKKILAQINGNNDNNNNDGPSNTAVKKEGNPHSVNNVYDNEGDGEQLPNYNAPSAPNDDDDLIPYTNR